MSGPKLPPDADARAHALDPARSYIVQAPAGSGKTGLLIQRYLSLLASVEAPEEIVAITFTRKATGEMRGRVLEALAKTEQPPADDPHVRLTLELAGAVRRRDRERGWDLAQNPARLRIHTIDALCHQLARRMPVLARFGGEAAPAEDPAPLYREAARRTLRLLDEPGPYAEPVRTLLAHLDNDIGRFESMVQAMLGHRDQWLRFLVGGPADAAAFRKILEATLRRAVEDSLANLRDAIPPELGAEIAALARFAGRTLSAAESSSPVARCAEIGELPGDSAERLDQWRGIAELFLKKDDQWRKQFTVNDGFPPGKDPTSTEMKSRVRGVAASLAGDEGLRERLAAVRVLPTPVYTDDEFDALFALLGVLKVASAMLRVVFTDRGSADFIEMVSAARTALGTEDEPTDLALALDYQISHLLVDEFQDTSFTHFHLLRQLVAGWTPGDGRTLFLVGDPMQSIYRFREADVGVYLNAWRHGLPNVALDSRSLTVNFRATAGLVTWTNEHFPKVLAGADDIGTGAVAYRASVPWNPAGGVEDVVLRTIIDGDDGGVTEADAVVDCVRKARADGVGDHIAVLVRSRTHLRAILPALEGAGIACRGVELRSVLEVPAVHDLISLCRALMHPADRVAWLAVLRAPWCGLLLEDLVVLTDDDDGATILELMGDAGRMARLSQDGRERLERVRGTLLEAVNRRGRASLRRQVEGAWQALGGPALIPPGDFAEAGACLDMIERYEQEQRVVDIDALEARLSELRLTPTASEGAVDVMTIHKAKGLEFDCVIVPGLHRSSRGDDKRLLAWSQYAGADADGELLLAPLPRGDESGPPVYGFLDVLEKRKQVLEEGRLLYVAATRARRRLCLVAALRRGDVPGELGAPKRNSLLARLWPALGESFLAAARAEPGVGGAGRSGAGDAAPDSIARVPGGWVPGAPSSPVAWSPRFPLERDASEALEFEWAGYGVRQIGIAVHGLLRRIADEGIDRWDPARVDGTRRLVRAGLAAAGLSGDELDAAVSHVLDALSQIIGDPRGRWILDPSHRDAQNELALSGILDGQLVHVVIDRSFVDSDGVRWIIDYKSGRHEGAGAEAFLNRERERYAPQLERYARLMSRWDERPLRVGLYFPLLRGWRSWTPDTVSTGSER